MITHLFGIPLYIGYNDLILWIYSQPQFLNSTFSDNTLLGIWIGVNLAYLYIWIKVIFPLIKSLLFIIRGFIR
jgi:hypothetical protein